jgi:hypothetical protein
LAAAPFPSRQKRFRAIPANGERDTEETGAFGSGGHPAVDASGSGAVEALHPSNGSTGKEELDISPELARANAVTALVASPLLSEPDRLKVDHISALLALAVDGPQGGYKDPYSRVLLAIDGDYMGSVGTPPFPTPDHPIAEGTLLRDAVL